MIITLGIILIGGHFLAAASIALLVSEHFPDWGVIVFLVYSIWIGAAIIRLQTRLERFFIRRHVARKPGSGWNVIKTTPDAPAKSRPKGKPRTPRKLPRVLAALLQRTRSST